VSGVVLTAGFHLTACWIAADLWYLVCVSCCLCGVVTVDLVAQQAQGQGDAVAPDVSKAVYALAAASGSDTAYDTLVSMYEQVITTVSQAAWPDT